MVVTGAGFLRVVVDQQIHGTVDAAEVIQICHAETAAQRLKICGSGIIGVDEKPRPDVKNIRNSRRVCIDGVTAKNVFRRAHSVVCAAEERTGQQRRNLLLRVFEIRVQVADLELLRDGEALTQQGETFFIGNDKGNGSAHARAGAGDGKAAHQVSGGDLTVSVCSEINVSHIVFPFLNISTQ